MNKILSGLLLSVLSFNVLALDSFNGKTTMNMKEFAESKEMVESFKKGGKIQVLIVNAYEVRDNKLVRLYDPSNTFNMSSPKGNLAVSYTDFPAEKKLQGMTVPADVLDKAKKAKREDLSIKVTLKFSKFEYETAIGSVEKAEWGIANTKNGTFETLMTWDSSKIESLKKDKDYVYK